MQKVSTPLYKLSVTLKPNGNRSYTMYFNQEKKSMVMPLPKESNMIVWRHSCNLMGMFGIRVTNILKDDEGNFVLSIPLKYWKGVQSFFNQ